MSKQWWAQSYGWWVGVLALAVGFPVAAGFGVWRWAEAGESGNWPTTNGVVTGQRAIDEGPAGVVAVNCKLHIDYDYKVNGTTYQGSRVGQTPTVSLVERDRILAAYPVGKAVVVYHHPTDPSRSLLEPPPRPNYLTELLIVGIFIGFGVFMIWRYRRQPPEPDLELDFEVERRRRRRE